MQKKFVTVFLKDDSGKNYNLFIDFFKGLVGNNAVVKQSNNILTIIFEDGFDISFSEIAIGLNTDLFITSKLFESRAFSNDSTLNEYVNMVESINFFPYADYYFSEFDLVIRGLGDYNLVRRSILQKYADDCEMLEAIKVYMESNMNITQAANKLFMHRNTLMNKIDKFIAVTGYDIKQFKNAYMIYHLV